MTAATFERAGRYLKPLLAGLLLFTVLIGASQALVALNARVSPSLPWFPLPALILSLGATLWLRGRTDIRLAHPPGINWPKAYAFACLATYAAVCISVFEGWWHDLDRQAPLWPDDSVSLAFQVGFLIVLPFNAALLAEVAFRGVIQTPLEKLMPIWPLLFFIAVVNALMHFYDPEQGSQWVRFISLNIAFGYVTWRTQSILPAIAAHVLMNVVEPVTRFVTEPVPYGSFAPPTLAFFGVSGMVALVAAVLLNRRIRDA